MYLHEIVVVLITVYILILLFSKLDTINNFYNKIRIKFIYLFNIFYNYLIRLFMKPKSNKNVLFFKFGEKKNSYFYKWLKNRNKKK